MISQTPTQAEASAAEVPLVKLAVDDSPRASAEPRAGSTPGVSGPTGGSDNAPGLGNGAVVGQPESDASGGGLGAATVPDPVQPTQPSDGDAGVAAPSHEGPATITVNVPTSSGAASGGGGMASGADGQAAAARYHAAVLTIQPRITTGRPAVVEDLATALPSAPAVAQKPSNVPAPQQPTGVFGRLTLTLAGSVVPYFLIALDAAPVGLVVSLMVLALMVSLALRRVVSVFGTWMRQGGYAHAARSDVASAMVKTFFATPFPLGYVTAIRSTHSPIFMVSETKSLTSVLPTLLERRRYI
ncbi:MAG TPA: hypothetical protein VMT30_00890 [Candidatus Saccharimonadia bacterium]|nr:hypothetical protein [Candidatus Saccharimonadia bacterium]